MIISESKLVAFVTAMIERGGSAADEAAIVARHLVDANMTGHDSHGVGLLPTYVRHLKGKFLHPNTPAERVRDDGPFLIFDGHRGYGQRVAREAMDAAVTRCREMGIAVLALRNAHHIGRVGAYAEQAIAAGMVSIHFVNVTDHTPSVAPFRGSDARFITNPVCLAMPGTDKTPPILLDMATSKIAAGKVRVAMNKGELLDEDTVIDSDGKPTRDPKVIFQQPKGAILPLGGHKGYGLALFCELLAGGVGGGGTIQPGNPRQESVVNNMLCIVLDPARLADMEWLKTEIDAVTAYATASPPTDPAAPVLLPGDPERIARKKRGADGIPIDDTSWAGILDAAAAIGLDQTEIAALTA